MFPRRFWPGRYFAPRYWPAGFGSDDDLIGVTPDVPNGECADAAGVSTLSGGECAAVAGVTLLLGGECAGAGGVSAAISGRV